MPDVAPTPVASKNPTSLHRRLKRLMHRPAMVLGCLVTVLVSAVCYQFLRPFTALLCGWDAGVIVYGITLITLLNHLSPEQMRRRAILYDQGRWVVLGVSVLASLLSVAAIVVEVAQSKGTPEAPFAVAIGLLTILLSWAFVHTVFALHYAHDWWRLGHGLLFPGNDRPTFSEFLYHSFTVATAMAVSDVQTQSPGMRALVGIHSVVTWLFNTAIVALGVGIVGSLMS